MPEEQAVPVTKLSFPFQLVISLITSIVTTAATIIISVMATTSGIRTDLALMKQLQEMRDKQYTEQIISVQKDVKMLQERILEVQQQVAEFRGEQRGNKKGEQ